MTVAELIAALAPYQPDAKVKLWVEAADDRTLHDPAEAAQVLRVEPGGNAFEGDGTDYPFIHIKVDFNDP